MLTAKTRTQARMIGSILNTIAGTKRFKQARSANADQSWGIPRTGKILSLGKKCVSRKPFTQIVDGVQVTFKRTKTAI